MIDTHVIDPSTIPTDERAKLLEFVEALPEGDLKTFLTDFNDKIASETTFALFFYD